MSYEYTPGPWFAVKHADPQWRVSVGSPDSLKIVAMTCQGNDEANARLIAAAPLMLFVLKDLLSELPSKRDWLNPNTERLMKEAINSAEGKL